MIDKTITLKCVVLTSLLFSLSAFSFAENNLGTREVLLDNASVEVVRLTYPVGTESGMHSHSHPNRAVYFVKGGKLELVPENAAQASKIITVADGKSLFLPATTHNVKNVGNTEIVIIETEIKAQ
ncbi:cupin domain-containing protein [Algibacillus agarilyticus]|uniref:cupin domain-containing protein n=1 Tax=Algibacillus agarilyticus TaxID=2234133 RepID=UPI000DCF9BC3|nr:cupin domain-containing protein [Algibacillus agarilyticus]